MKLLSRLTFLSAGVIAILVVSGLSVTAQSTIWQIVNGVVRGPVPFAVGPLSVSSTAVLVSGGLGVGVANTTAGSIQANTTIVAGTDVYAGGFLAAGSGGTARLASSASGKLELNNIGQTGGIGLDFATDGLLLFKNRAQNAAGGIGFASLAVSGTAPTVTSAGTSPSVTASNGTAAFRVNVGTGGTATTIVMAMPAATTGWNCHAENITAAAANRANQAVKQQSSTTTAVTVQNQTVSTGAALAFTASDIVSFICVAY